MRVQVIIRRPIKEENPQKKCLKTDEQIGYRRSLVGDGVYELASTLAVTTLGKQAVLMERVDWSVGQQHRRLHGRGSLD